VPDGAYDLGGLDSYPAPWSIAGGVWLDANRKRVAALGANITGYALLPTSQAEADQWAQILHREGYRAVRLHHWDIALHDSLQAHTQRLDWLCSALKRWKIPWMTDGTSERCDKQLLYNQNAAERDKWRGQVEHLLTHRPAAEGLQPWVKEPYFLGICPVNEDVAVNGKSVWDGVTDLDNAQYCDNNDWYRSQLAAMGSSKPTWACNAGIPGGWSEIPAGEVETWHRYTDHPLQWPTRYMEYLENDQPWNHYQPRTGRPLMLEEMGKLWPASNRGLCEQQIVDYALAVGAQLVFPFARAVGPSGYTATGGTLDMFTYYNDPVRTSTARYIARMLNRSMGNYRYTPGEAQNTGFASFPNGPWLEVSDPGTAPIVSSTTGAIDVPDGMVAFAIGTDGKRAQRLAQGGGVAIVESMWTELVPKTLL